MTTTLFHSLPSTLNPSPSSTTRCFQIPLCTIGNPAFTSTHRRRLSNFAAGQGSEEDGTLPPGDGLGVRFRRGSRKRLQRQMLQNREGIRREDRAPKRRKEWEEMSTKEKAAELWAGERGALYWLNKLSYASIFVVLGGWILFRFVGPALNLYQLDSQPLSSSSIIKG